MNLVIQNAAIVTMHDQRLIHDGLIAVEDGCIVDVGKARRLGREYASGYEKIDAKGKVIIPGLINTHQHAAMSLLRGYADDFPLKEWLERWIWPIEKHLTPHDIYIGALVTALESILGGTTTVNTMYHYTPGQNEAKAFAETGIRGVVGHVCFSSRKKEDRKALADLVSSWHNRKDGLIRASVDPHSPYTVDSDYMKELSDTRKELERRYGSKEAPVILHTHIAETSEELQIVEKNYGKKLRRGIMSHLDSLGILGEHVVAAHCVFLTEKDIDIMKRRGVKASHNPVSNLKLASGISPVPEMLERGLTVSLGTDSPCSNNTADMFETMKVAALLHKMAHGNPTLLPAEHVLEMATIKGAKALSWADEIGSIEVGKRADLVLIDFLKPHLYPRYKEASHLVYAARSGDVHTVIINGRIIVEDRQFTSLKTENVLHEAQKAKERLLERLEANAK